MKCRHEFRSRETWIAYMPGVDAKHLDHYRDGSPKYNVMIDTSNCMHCGAWLSLGPANDDDERVKVEIAAARLAIDGIDRWSATFEAYGANLFDNEPNNSAPANVGEWAGYLAACIVAHEEDQ